MGCATLADLRLGVATRDTEPAPVRIGRRGERRAQPLTWRGHPAAVSYTHLDVYKRQEQIRAAASDRSPLRVRAGGSKDFYGNTPRGVLLDPRAARGIVAYDPSELSIAVRCGTPLAQLEAALEERGQMLAFEPPHFGAHATIGGCIATGLAGPRRAANGYCYGGVRDFVLGAKLLDGQGQLLTCGGLVMKNVAGYDLARLLTGSMGVLGVLIEVALKVVPKPRMEATLRMPMDEATALARLNEWGAQPWPISALSLIHI